MLRLGLALRKSKARLVNLHSFQTVKFVSTGVVVPPPIDDGDLEVLTEAEQQEKLQIIQRLSRKLAGPLADETGRVPEGDDRPTVVEVDGPAHFYAETTKPTSHTKLKHRLLTGMGYRVVHVPYFEWRDQLGQAKREKYLEYKILYEESSAWMDAEDEKILQQRINNPNEVEEFIAKKKESAKKLNLKERPGKKLKYVRTKNMPLDLEGGD
eukprot:Platyproteum_vivax@DN801_c0_g1_i1.p1